MSAPLPQSASPPATPAPSLITTHPILGVFGVLLGAMIATCTGRLISVGLADLRGALHLGVDEASWIGTSFNAALMFIGPFSVYLGGLLGARRVLLACAGLFTLISVLLPFASSLPVMLLLLVLAGLTAGTFYPLTLSFVLRNLPMKYVLLGIAMYAMDIVFTTNMATSLEAWYMDHLSWHWIFWNSAVLTPLMMVLIYFGIPWQPLPKPKEGQPRPSWRGFLYASLGFALLYIALDQGQRLDWMNSATIVALTVTGLLLLLATVVRHLTMPNPLVNFKFLIRRNTLLLGVVLIFFRFVMLATVVVIPSYLGSIKGYLPAADRTGLALGRFTAVHLWPTRDVSAEIHRCPLDPDRGLHARSHRLSDECAALLRVVGSELLALAGGHGGGTGPRVQFHGRRHRAGGNQHRRAHPPHRRPHLRRLFPDGATLRRRSRLAFMQHFLSVREQFHSNILGLGVHFGEPATSQRLLGLSAAMAAKSSGPDAAIGRAGEILGLQVRQQAFTLAISDCFTLVAWSVVCCLIVVACMARVPTQYQQVVAAAAKAA